MPISCTRLLLCRLRFELGRAIAVLIRASMTVGGHLPAFNHYTDDWGRSTNLLATILWLIDDVEPPNQIIFAPAHRSVGLFFLSQSLD